MNVTVTDVLGSLFNPTDMVCFRVFDDKKGGTYPGSKLQCECGKYKGIEDTLKNHNALGRGIFFVVNYGGHDDANITRVNAQFVEMDNDSFEEQAEAIKDAVSRRALQCYVIEGAYPESLDYLVENYGLAVNREDYKIVYIPYAENLPPEVKVIYKGEK